MMKKSLIVSVFLLLFISSKSQEWLKSIHAAPDGRPSYPEAIQKSRQLRNLYPDQPLSGEKQVLRASFLLDNRLDAAGTLPSDIFWAESKKVISQRNLNLSQQSSWSFIGPTNSTIKMSSGEVGGSGRIDCMAFHPTDPDIFYAGAPSGGLWRTTDRGLSWESLTDCLPVLGISDIDLHPNDPNTLFICTGTRDVWWETYTIGILKSEDGGLTWNETGLQYSVQQNRAVHELWIHPVNPQIMLAATSNGMYRSVDGGDHWDFNFGGNFMDIQQIQGNPDIVLATTFNYNGGAKLYRSTDGGASFTYIPNVTPTSIVNRISLAVTPANPGMVYALYSKTSDNGFYGVYVSMDQGLTWTQTPNTTNVNLLGWAPSGTDVGGQGYFTLAISVDPVDPMHLHVGGVNIWESFDGGVTWQLNAQYYGGGAQYIHADIHTLAFNPVNGEFYAATDGGIYWFDQGTNLWTNRSDGLEIMQFYRVGLFQPDPDRMMGSPQDNGTVLFTDTICYEINLAEACDNFFDHFNRDTLYFGGYAAGIRRSYNGGYSFVSIIPPGESKYRFNPPFMIHPTDPATIYCAYKDVWKSTNRGTAWVNLSGGLTGGQDFENLEIYDQNDQIIYAATFDHIWRTQDEGGSWDYIRAGLPNGQSITNIAISDKDPDHVWVTMGGFVEGKKVYRTTDGGDTWTNISGSLPNVPINCITYEPGSDDALYLGSDVGVFYTNKHLADWVDYSRDLPAVIIDELEVHTSTSTIVAATYGRGMWKNALADPLTVDIAPKQPAHLVVHPNPAADQVNIAWQPPSPGRYVISIVGMDGRKWASETIYAIGMKCSLKIETETLPAGFYILTIKGEKYSENQKLCIK